MRDFMITLLTCSVTMSAIALLYMVVTPLLVKRYAERGRYYAWLVVVLGLLIPFRPQWEYAIIQVTVPPDAAVAFPAMQPGVQLGGTAPVVMNDIHAVASSSPSLSWWQVAAAVWAAGMVLAIVYHAVRHYRFIKTAQRWSERVQDEQILALFDDLKTAMGVSGHVALYRCPGIGTPMIVDFVKPRILLPVKDVTLDELQFILRHELTHYKRKDLYVKCLVLLATCMHWFNPAVYLIARAIDAACELSCDAEVVRSAGEDTRRQYSETIIGVVRHQAKLKTALSTNFYGGKKGLKKRIFSIMDTAKKKAGIVILCVALVATAGTGFALTATSQGVDIAPANTAFSGAAMPYDEGTDIDAVYLSLVSDDLRKSIKPYAHLGLSIDAERAVILYMQRPVREIFDPATGELITETLGPDGFNGRTIPDAVDLTVQNENGKPVGFYIATQEEYDARTEERRRRVSDQLFDSDYEAHGISFDSDGNMLFENKLVRYFWDGFTVDAYSYATHYEYLHEEGVVDVYTVRSTITNTDGSINPHGELLDIVAYSQQEFDARDISELKNPSQVTAEASNTEEAFDSANAWVGSSQAASGPAMPPEVLAKEYAVYTPFGVTYDKDTDSFTYNGKLVRHFLDVMSTNGESLSGGSFKGTLRSLWNDDGEIDIEVIRDFSVPDENGYGKLTGIRIVNG